MMSVGPTLDNRLNVRLGFILVCITCILLIENAGRLPGVLFYFIDHQPRRFGLGGSSDFTSGSGAFSKT